VKILALLVALGVLPFFAGEYYVNLASQIFIFAVFAASINLLLGYGGLPTLGHASYLGVAAYASALLGLKLGLSPALAPIKAGVFPLVKKDGMPEMAHRIANELRDAFPVFYDDSGAIGRRYRRQDEIGTPFCITVDGESSGDNTVTVRDRDTLAQERISIDRLRDYIGERISA